MANKNFQLIVAGGGITGSALLYTLSRYTNLQSIALLEKHDGLGQANTSGLRNSQTLHFGDIETNYNLEKAKKVKIGASMVAKYLDRLPSNNGIFLHSNSMILAIGENEIKTLKERFEQFKEAYPDLKRIEADEIAKIEPQIMQGRDPQIPVLALYSTTGYTVNYQKLAESFVQNTDKNKTEIFFNTKIKSIKKSGDNYIVTTDQDTFTAPVVVVALGTHSLLFAKHLGYGLEYAVLPVIGDYYTSDHRLLNGKVYTMQNEKLPFAAVHGDPNIFDTAETRFGPTALSLPILERGSLKTLPDFFRSAGFDWNAFMTIVKIHSDPDILKFIIENFIFTLPFIGRSAFVKNIAKIIPTIKKSDLQSKKGLGGIRPQLVNKKERRLLLGAAEILGDKIIFNVTPSPGATACLQNALGMTKKIEEFFGGQIQFDETSFKRDFID
ncbi:MAG: FAD-dependent oxidoreductase [Candidatus Magasanikbacteria bacterium]|nr:FAD-dependent oxidoreductase [Candidatus Magasanikbacteria bacterium]